MRDRAILKSICLALLHRAGLGWAVLGCAGPGWARPGQAGLLVILLDIVVAEKSAQTVFRDRIRNNSLPLQLTQMGQIS